MLDVTILGLFIFLCSCFGLSVLVIILMGVVARVSGNEPSDNVALVGLATFPGLPLVALVVLAIGRVVGFVDMETQQELSQIDLDKTAITQADYDSVETGVTRTDVVARFGPTRPPYESDTFAVEEPVGLECIHYNHKGTSDEESIFRFCFNPQSDRMQDKSGVRVEPGPPLIVFTGH